MTVFRMGPIGSLIFDSVQIRVVLNDKFSVNSSYTQYYCTRLKGLFGGAGRFIPFIGNSQFIFETEHHAF